MKNTVPSFRLAQAILATALFLLGFNQAAAQIDPIRHNLHHLSPGVRSVEDTQPGANCIILH
jgi:hypothetical protein